MSILVDNASRVVVQGITGREGAFHTARMLAAGTNIVAGVTPGHGGRTIHGVPVYDSVHEAMATISADVAVIFVPAPRARDALFEAADAGAKLIVCITEGIPVRDMAEVMAHLPRRGCRLIGPNCPGLITPARCSAGIMPSEIFMPGAAGVVSRSGTLTYEVVHELTEAGIGQSTAVGMGGDAVHGIGFIECLELFEADRETEGVALIGEIGGDDEERAAAYIHDHMTKPVVAYVAGHSAPPGRRMGHAGAIIEGTSGTAATKKAALEAAGIPVAASPSELARLLGEAIKRRRST
ncbi:MAG TPA: succinate--CoA ligase subunit alpha [Thermoleophilia bacterium]|nr:succinate--CoA ligase subunit alpha [Thermoleophilia bacterium]